MPRPLETIGSQADGRLAGELAAQGFVRLAPGAINWLPAAVSDQEWADFAQSWNRLGLDRYMADGGRIAGGVTPLWRSPRTRSRESRTSRIIRAATITG